MKSVVDTSALIALLYPDDTHNKAASAVLGEAYSEGAMVINPITYAELAPENTFNGVEDLDGFLEDTGLTIEEPSKDTLYRAGEEFQRYLDNRIDGFQCSSCGHTETIHCESCDAKLTSRQHLPSDFIIGSHAETQADALITFDTGFFQSHFETNIKGIQ